MRTRTLVLLAMIITCTTVDCAAAKTENDLIEQIRTAWQDRQNRCQSGIVRWEQRYHHPFNEDFDNRFSPRSNYIDYGIESDLRTCRFAFMGKAHCLDFREGRFWTWSKEGYQQQQRQLSLLPDQSKKLIIEKGEHIHTGRIQYPQMFRIGQAELRPLVIAFRPFARAYSTVDLSAWEVASKSVFVDGRKCVQLVRKNDLDPYRREMWLDIERDYLPLRELKYKDNHLWSRLVIEYQPHEELNWVPRHWEYSVECWQDLDDNFHHEIEERYTATVIELTLNQPVPATTFDFPFPPRTRIYNEFDRNSSLVRNDGTVQPLEGGETPEELEQILAAEPPGKARQLQWKRILAYTLIGGFIYVIATLAWHARKRQKVNNSS